MLRIADQLGSIDLPFVDSEAGRRRFLLMDQAGVAKLIAAGMTIGSHTNSHCLLAVASDELAWSEIESSRRCLSAALHQPIWARAYPFGDAQSVSARDLRLAEKADFECAFMNGGGGFGAELPRYAVPRIHVTSDMGLGEFEAHLSGFHRDLQRRLGRSQAGVQEVERGIGA
jgi:hypothetical protein